MGAGISKLYKNTKGSQISLYIPDSEHKEQQQDTSGVALSGKLKHFNNNKSKFHPGDIVVLIREFNNLPQGTKGVVISQYDIFQYEVEFFYDDGSSIGLFVVLESVLELLENIKSL